MSKKEDMSWKKRYFLGFREDTAHRLPNISGKKCMTLKLEQTQK